MPELPLTYEQLGTLLFFGGFSWWAFRWAYRNSKAQAEDRPREPRSSDEPDDGR